MALAGAKADLRHAGGELEKAWLVLDWPAGDPGP
jgi:hypothetical protein